MENKKTISEILDKIEYKEKMKKEAEQAKKEAELKRNREEVDNAIKAQFKLAFAILGHRFVMQKQHDTMYYFRFRCNRILSCYIFSDDKLNISMRFKFTPEHSSIDDSGQLKKLYDKKIIISELSELLVKWVKLSLDDILKETPNGN